MTDRNKLSLTDREILPPWLLENYARCCTAENIGVQTESINQVQHLISNHPDPLNSDETREVIEESLVDALANCLENGDRPVRREAINALDTLAAEDASTLVNSIDPLVRALHDEDREIRDNAARIIGVIGGENSSLVANAIPSLVTALYEAEYITPLENVLSPGVRLVPTIATAHPSLANSRTT